MTLPLPALSHDIEAQQSLEVIARQFPIQRQNIANDAVGSAQIAAGAVGSSEIADDSIVNADINSAAAIAASKLDPKLVQSTVENLKIIRGTFDTTTPSITVGSGFTLTKNAVGDVTINFTAAFSAAPTPSLAINIIGRIPHVVGAPTTTSMRVFRNNGADAGEDGVIHFTAIGPR